MERLFVYIDESGTFDKVNYDYFVYGGILVLGEKAKTDLIHKQQKLEKIIKRKLSIAPTDELKASRLNLKIEKRFIRLSTDNVVRFAVVIRQKKLHEYVFNTKHDKQRYLDFALKIAIKRALQQCFRKNIYQKEHIDSMVVIVDEHSSSTSGKYNLYQTINAEFRTGVYNPEWNHLYPPVFSKDFPEIQVNYVDSAKTTLVRVADITANWVYRAYRDLNEDVSTWNELDEILKDIDIFHLP